jgi:hypothetical protein
MDLRLPRAALTLALLTGLAGPLQAGAPGEDDPTRYIAFVEEFAGACVQRSGVQLLIRSTHPSRTLRVWLDRFHMGVGTGDRSRSDLAPAAEPQALGCSRSATGVQEWRVVRAVWID